MGSPYDDILAGLPGLPIPKVGLPGTAATRRSPYDDILGALPGFQASVSAQPSTSDKTPYDDILADIKPPQDTPEPPSLYDRYIAPAGKAVADVAEKVGEFVPSPIKAALQAPGAGTGLIGLGLDEDAYWRAYEENLPGITRGEAREPTTSEQIRAAPGLGQVLREKVAPEPLESRAGEAAVNVGSLAADILTDPSTFLTGGLGRAGRLGRFAATGERAADIAPDLGRAGAAIEAASRVVGSPAAAAVYGPEIVTGVARGVEAGDPYQVATMGGLGALMGRGIAEEARGIRRAPLEAPGPVQEQQIPVRPLVEGDVPPPVWEQGIPPDFAAPRDVVGTQQIPGDEFFAPGDQPGFEAPEMAFGIAAPPERVVAPPGPVVARDLGLGEPGAPPFAPAEAPFDVYPYEAPRGFEAATVPEAALLEAAGAPQAAPRLAPGEPVARLSPEAERVATPRQERAPVDAAILARDSAEAERLLGRLEAISDRELDQRAKLYRRKGLGESLQIVEEESARRRAAVEPEAPRPQEAAPAEVPRGPERRQADVPVVDERRRLIRRQIEQEFGGMTPEARDAIAAERYRALTDPVTGLANKLGWQGIVAAKAPEDFVLFADLKKFKPFNDKFGHHVGDQVLRRVGEIVSRHVAPDTAARPGGDEFSGLLRGLDIDAANAKAADIQREVAESRIAVRNPQTGETVDIPLAEVHIGIGATEEAADAAANAAAAASRKGGRGDVDIVGGGARLQPPAEPAGPVPPSQGTAAPRVGEASRGGLGDRPPELAEAPPQTTEPEPTLASTAIAESAGLPVSTDTIKRAFRAGRVTEVAGGGWDIELPRGRRIRVRVNEDGIEFSPDLIRSTYGRDLKPTEMVVGSWQLLDRGGIVSLAKESGEKTVHHEAFHAAMDLALRPAERREVFRRFESHARRRLKDWDSLTDVQRLKAIEEIAADAYSRWSPRERADGTFQKILSFFRNLYRTFAPTWKSAFERVRSGEAYGRPVGDAAAEGPRFATAPKQPPQVKPIPPGARPGPRPAPGTPSPEGLREPLGRTMAEAGVQPHRVDAKVEQLQEVAPDAKLSRDAPRTWESLDPDIRRKLGDVLNDEAKELSLYERARTGRINDIEVQTLDALVAGKREAYDTARHRLLAAEQSGRTATGESQDYLRASLDAVAADLAKAARADVEAGTKLARALAARARVMTAQVSATSPDAFLRRLFREIPGLSERQAGELLRVFQERPGDLQDALHAAMTPKRFDKFLEFWKAGLVSAPGTQGANILGNVGEQIMRLGETATAAVLDPFLGGGRTRLGGEARFEVAGGLKGAGKSLGRLSKSLKDIFTLAPETVDLTQPLERQTGHIGGKGGRAVRIPFRLLGAFDDFFKGVGGEAELYKLAFRHAEGNKARATQIIENPTADLLAQVKRSRQERTFQDPNRMAQAIERLRSDQKWLHVVMPFVQTPSNILRVTVQRSPAGFVEAGRSLAAYRKALRSGAAADEVARLKGEAVDKLARPLLGTLLMGTFVGVAKAGGMTGSGPTDHRERNLLRDTGWQPYSFVFDGPQGKVYVPFNRFEPVSSLLGFAADMAELKDQRQAGDLVDKFMGSIAQNLTSKTYLQGLSDASAAINDPKRFASQYAANLASSLVPNIVRKTAQAVDPTMRETKADDPGLTGIGQRVSRAVAASLPFASRTLPERRSGLGETIKRPGGAGALGGAARFLSPVVPSAEREGRALERLLVEIGAVRSPPQREVTIRGRKIRLTQDEYESLNRADLAATKYLRGVIQNPRFRRWDDETQRRFVDKVYDRSRSQARRRLYRSSAFVRRVRVSGASSSDGG